MKASVIIPVYNAEETIRLCLESLLNQNYPKDDYEIICVNDGSTDKSLEIIEDFTGDTPIWVFSQNNSGPAKARNLGVQKARGEIVIFTDSDCELDTNWIFEMILPFWEQNIGGSQGAYRTKQKGLIPLYEQIYIEESYERFKKQKYIDTVGTYSAAYRRQLFLNLGGFNERYKTACGEDFEFSYLMSRKGYKIVFVEKAICYHKHPEKLINYMKIKYRRGFWRTLMYKNNKDKIVNDSYSSLNKKFQFLTAIFILISLPISILSKELSFMPFLTLFLYFGFCTPLFFFAWKRSKKIAFLFPIITFLRLIFFVFGMINGMFYIRKYGPKNLRSSHF